MIRFPQLEELSLAVAAFSERTDGDCAVHGPSRDAFCAACGVDSAALVRGRQVHGVRVQCVREPERGRGALDPASTIPDTDALVTNVPGLPLAILVADCVPVFLFDPDKRVAAVVHAGREGTFHGIVGEAVATMKREYGSLPGNVHAVVGPSAGPCCYEVSEAMATEWVEVGYPAEGRRLDLWQANVMQLTALGVPESHIAVSGQCTICSGRFFSHRAEADGARNMALVMI